MWCYALGIVVLCVAGQLKANNAQLMEGAVQAVQNLAQQCSDPTAVQDIVTHLFRILGGELTISHIMSTLIWFLCLGLLSWSSIVVVAGSEGKLTVVAQKMSVLSGTQPFKHFVFMSLAV